MSPTETAWPGGVSTSSFDQGWAHRARLAAADLRQGARLWRLLLALSVADIRYRYRGSILGPFWLTLSTAIMIAGMGVVFPYLFRMPAEKYLPFLAVSLVLWNFLSTLINEGCTCYVHAEATIRSMRVPFSIHAGRTVLRNLLIFLHNVIVIVGVFAVIGVPASWRMMLAAPGLLLWLANGFTVALLLGAVCARFRDVPPIVAAFLQVAFFVTPVMWSPETLTGRPFITYLLTWNPFYKLLEIVRAPLLGEPLPTAIILSALGYSLLLAVLAGLAFVRTRGRIAYWI